MKLVVSVDLFAVGQPLFWQHSASLAGQYRVHFASYAQRALAPG